MKKTILALVAILIVVYAALSILGAGGEYAAEKLFYHATKTQSEITDNPDVAPPRLLASIQNDLENLIHRYPNTNIAKRACVKLAELYIFAKKYNDAFSSIDRIINKYRDDPVALSMAYFLRGTIYEKQDKWDKALQEFTIVKNKYTNTQLGMEMPLYMARYYRKKGESAQAAKSYDEAAQFYEKIGNDNKGKTLGYMASSFIFQTYLETANYEKAGEALESAFTAYPSPVAYTKLLPYVEYIYVEKLNKPDKAVEIYKNIQGRSKDEKFNQFLGKRIEVIKKQK